MARTVTTTFALRDNYSPAMRRAQKTTTAFQKDVKKVAKELDLANKKRLAIRAEKSPAIKAINDVKKQLSGIRSTVVNIKARTENFKRDMAPVTNSIKKLSVKAWNVTIKLKDKVSAGLRSIGRLVKSAARVATVAVGAAGAAGAYVLGKGMSLEQYQMAIGHFVGVNNPSMSANQVQAQSDKYMDWLSENAKATPFSTGDVIAAGSRAVGVTGGNTDAAQGFVRVAEDMAALTPGKTVMDAMEALADAQLGEMERMKEFNFKLTQEALTQAGGDLFKTKNANGMTIMDVFGGGSVKMSTSASGKWSTVMGNLEDGLSKGGLSLLTALQPLLDLMVTNSDKIGLWFEDVGKTIGTWITDTLPGLIPKVKQLWEDAKGVFTSISSWVSEKSAMLAPFKGFLAAEGLKLMLGGESKLQGIVDSFNGLINSLIDGLNYIATNWGSIGPAISGLITLLPQLMLAFAGFKLISFGMTAGKALGGLFGGLGQFLGQSWGNKDKGTQTGGMPNGSKPVDTKVPDKVKDAKTTKTYDYNYGDDAKKGSALRAAWEAVKRWGEEKAATYLPASTNMMNGMPVIADWFQQNADMILGYPKQVFGNIEALTGVKVPGNFNAYVKQVDATFNYYVKQMVDSLKASFAPVQQNPYNPTTGTSTGMKSPRSMFPAEWYSPAVLPAPVLTPMDPNTNLIPDGVFAKSLTKVSAFVAKLGSQVGAGLQSWVKTLLSGGSVTGTVNIKQVMVGGGSFILGGIGGGIMEAQPRAAGLMHVPYDNYPALLHQGEAVLPASAAGAYREGKTGNTQPQINLNVYVSGIGRDTKELTDSIMRAAVRRLGEVAFNMG